MKRIQEDFVKLARAGDFDDIAPGCNCSCIEGAGFDCQIKEACPEGLVAEDHTLVEFVEKHPVWRPNFTDDSGCENKKNIRPSPLKS